MRSAGVLILSLACVTAAFEVSGSTAFAQDGPRIELPQGWRVGHVRVTGHRAESRRTTTVAAGSQERDLTITRRFAPAPTDEPGSFFESGTAYNNIRAFVPDPKTDSGTQLPYGLDGIGGYGSDLGFSAGQDTAVYDRGM